MAQQPDSNLLEQAEIIRDETTANANTATRVGTMLVDIVDSKYNRPYQVYTAILTQASNAAPVATVLENDFTSTLTWVYNSPGNYTLYAGGDSIFTANKTVCFTNQISDDNNSMYLFMAMSSTATGVDVIVSNGSSNINDILGNGNTACIEIRVYN